MNLSEEEVGEEGEESVVGRGGDGQEGREVGRSQNRDGLLGEESQSRVRDDGNSTSGNYEINNDTKDNNNG